MGTANVSGGDEEGTASATDLAEAHRTIQQLQGELKDLKKKVQTQTLKGYNSSKKGMSKKKLTSKKTFSSGASRLNMSGESSVDEVAVKQNPMIRDQDKAYDNDDDDKNELI